jgi:hypothetical protein
VALLSYYSDLDITVVNGVLGADISSKAFPGGGGKPDNLNDGELGCWRAHMDILRIVVEKRLDTALILEADVDWDVRVKDQFTRLSESLPDSTASRPYGMFVLGSRVFRRKTNTNVFVCRFILDVHVAWSLPS